MKKNLPRREFLKTSLIVGAGAMITASEPFSFMGAPPAAAAFPDLAVAQGPSPAKVTTAALGALGGIGRFISKGDVVVIKPNIGWDKIPEQAANTNPEVVATLIELCFSAGAHKIKIFDNTCNESRRCYTNSGIMAAALAKGAEVTYFDSRKLKDVKLQGQRLKSWPIYTELLEADKIINVPIAKHHGMATLTMAMKNWMGVIGGHRAQFHQDFEHCLADIATVIKPTLTVLDAVRILVNNGPQGGSLADVRKKDTIIAGVDQVAVDAYGATLFGRKAGELPYLLKAEEMGLGRTDLKKLKIQNIKV
jgi:uncharacterized protein (DUF362 family)